MAQSTVVAPTSGNGPVSGAQATADDLLAQMAGPEIDRLLSDAEKEAKPLDTSMPPLVVDHPVDDALVDDILNQSNSAAASTEAPATPVAPNLPAETVPPKGAKSEVVSNDELDQLMAELQGPSKVNTDVPTKPVASPAVAKDPAAAKENETGLGHQLDNLFDELTGAKPPQPPEPPVPAAAPATPAAVAETPIALAPAAKPPTPEVNNAMDAVMASITKEPEPEPAAASINTEPLAAVVPASPAPSPQASVAEVLDEALKSSPISKPSIFIRLLEIINAPFDMMSDEVRDAAGKVAIITAMNSFAVLIYVLLFRSH